MPSPLNIVWICTDQQPLANRPALAAELPLQSRMAREGTRFDRAFTVLPICSPARASMLTGLYPSAHGLTENDGRFGGRPGLDGTDWLVHRAFVGAGYRTAWFGKWHLDNHRSAADYGFEGFSVPGYGFPYATGAYRGYLDRMNLADPVATVELPGESRAAPGTRWHLSEIGDWPDFEAGSALLEGPAEAHEAFFVAHLASRWIEAAGEDPFFLRVDPWGPHPPYLVAPPFQDSLTGAGDLRSSNFWSDLAGRPAHHRDYRDYWTGRLRLDDDGWQLLARRSMEQAALVETAMLSVLGALDRAGLADRTLVIVCADHGDAVASNGGVANKGGLMVEETLRIPLLLRGPEVPAGGTQGRIVTNLDIAPTLLEMAGLAPNGALHGQSLVSLLAEPSAPWRKGAMLQHYGLHVPLMQRAWREERWMLVLQENGFVELYDLAQDPAEMNNLAADRAMADRLETMRAALFAAMERVHDDGPGQRRLISNAKPD